MAKGKPSKQVKQPVQAPAAQQSLSSKDFREGYESAITQCIDTIQADGSYDDNVKQTVETLFNKLKASRFDHLLDNTNHLSEQAYGFFNQHTMTKKLKKAVKDTTDSFYDSRITCQGYLATELNKLDLSKVHKKLLTDTIKTQLDREQTYIDTYRQNAETLYKKMQQQQLQDSILITSKLGQGKNAVGMFGKLDTKYHLEPWQPEHQAYDRTTGVRFGSAKLPTEARDLDFEVDADSFKPEGQQVFLPQAYLPIDAFISNITSMAKAIWKYPSLDFLFPDDDLPEQHQLNKLSTWGKVGYWANWLLNPFQWIGRIISFLPTLLWACGALVVGTFAGGPIGGIICFALALFFKDQVLNALGYEQPRPKDEPKIYYDDEKQAITYDVQNTMYENKDPKNLMKKIVRIKAAKGWDIDITNSNMTHEEKTMLYDYARQLGIKHKDIKGHEMFDHDEERQAFAQKLFDGDPEAGKRGYKEKVGMLDDMDFDLKKGFDSDSFCSSPGDDPGDDLSLGLDSKPKPDGKLKVDTSSGDPYVKLKPPKGKRPTTALLETDTGTKARGRASPHSTRPRSGSDPVRRGNDNGNGTMLEVAAGRKPADDAPKPPSGGPGTP